MLAARMYGKMDIRLEEIPIPEIGTGEILLRVKAAAICGTDVRMYRNGAKGIDENHPLIIGHELSGVIEKAGTGVYGYREGQRVAVAPNMGCGVCDTCVRGDGHLCNGYQALGINLDGGFAEYMRIPEQAVRGGNVTLLENNVSFQEAAINEALSCVYNGFEHCNIRPGDTVLVVGAGPIGLMHGMMAVMAGAGMVIFSDLSQERLEECRRINPAFQVVRDHVEEYIEEKTKGRGVDVCITACPSGAAQSMALRVAAVGGRVLFFGGVPSDKQEVVLNTNLIHYKQLLVTGTTRASLEQYRRTLQFISTGVLDVKQLITSEISLHDFHKGMELAASASGLKNVIIME